MKVLSTKQEHSPNIVKMTAKLRCPPHWPLGGDRGQWALWAGHGSAAPVWSGSAPAPAPPPPRPAPAPGQQQIQPSISPQLLTSHSDSIETPAFASSVDCRLQMSRQELVLVLSELRPGCEQRTCNARPRLTADTAGINTSPAAPEKSAALQHWVWGWGLQTEPGSITIITTVTPNHWTRGPGSRLHST